VVYNKVYFGTLFGRLIHIFGVYINNGATGSVFVFVQSNCQYSCTVSDLFETETEMVSTAPNVL